mgnify:CR=1 FL=1
MKKRTNKACRLLVVPAMMLAGLSGLCDAGDNLVPNAGFEKTQEGNLAGWTQPNDLTIMWEKGGVTGRCLHFDTDVYLRQWKEKQKNPEKEIQKKKTKGNKYNTVAGSEGVKAWSQPINVEPGRHYLMQVDVKGKGGEPFVYLKGYSRCSEAEAERHGKMPFFKPHAESQWYALVSGGDTRRKPEEGDFIQVFRKRLVCRIPGDSAWRRFRQPVKIRTGRFACDRILLMLYAFWPPGDYYFDNVVFKPITEEKASEVRKKRKKHGTLINK